VPEISLALWPTAKAPYHLLQAVLENKRKVKLAEAEDMQDLQKARRVWSMFDVSPSRIVLKWRDVKVEVVQNVAFVQTLNARYTLELEAVSTLYSIIDQLNNFLDEKIK
jgi:hypothetical protein